MITKYFPCGAIRMIGKRVSEYRTRPKPNRHAGGLDKHEYQSEFIERTVDSRDSQFNGAGWRTGPRPEPQVTSGSCRSDQY